MEEHYFGWLRQNPDQRDELFRYQVPQSVLADLPASVDLEALGFKPPLNKVLNQGSLGSCGPNAVSEDIAYSALSQDNIPSIVMPSRLFIYYNTRKLMGTVNSDSGVDNRTMLKALAQYGWCDETLWPYDISKYRNQPTQACYDQGSQRQIIAYHAVAQQILTMKGVLANGDPFLFGFTVYESFEYPSTAQTGIVPMPRSNERVLGGHDVWITGYNDAKAAFRFRNDWGDSWGDHGCGWMPYQYATNPQLSSDFWTVEHSALQPPMPGPLPTAIITANPPQIQPGGKSTLIWSSTNATSATLNGSPCPVSGSDSATPTSTKDYVLVATGPGGSTTATARVEVLGSPPPSGDTVSVEGSVARVLVNGNVVYGR